MDDRLHAALDGDEITLTAAEHAALSQAEGLIDRVLSSVATEALPDLAPGVMQRIQSLDVQPAFPPDSATDRFADHTEGLLAWLWRPRAISFAWRPAYSLCGAAALVLAVMFGVAMRSDQRATADQVLYSFSLHAPGAQHVAVAGDFTNWKPAHVMQRTEPGVWTVVVPLDPGVHDYAFVVDGEHWVPDPMAPAVDDGFGGRNSRVAVITSDKAES